MNPCIEYCYFRFGKRYSADCDTSCEFAKAMKDNRVLISDVSRLITQRDEAVNCIYAVQKALESRDIAGAMSEIVTYNYRKASLWEEVRNGRKQNKLTA